MPTKTRTSKAILFVCGSRSLLSDKSLEAWGRDTILKFASKANYVFSGGAVGPDSWAIDCAKYLGAPHVCWNADGSTTKSWDKSQSSWFYKDDGRSFIYTNNISFPRGGAGYTEVIDVTRKGAVHPALVFAPSWGILAPEIKARRQSSQDDEDRWNAYSEAYKEELEMAISEHPDEWSWLCKARNPTLLCYCKDALRCHRSILAHRLSVDTGAPYWGDGPTPLQRNTAMAEHLAKLSSVGHNVLAIALVDPRSKTGGTLFTIGELRRLKIETHVFNPLGERRMKRDIAEMMLPELAQELHQICTGSQCDFGDDRRGLEIYVLLERRLGDWSPSPACTLAYDEAVRALCRVAVSEYADALHERLGDSAVVVCESGAKS